MCVHSPVDVNLSQGLVQSKQNNHCASSENSTIAQATMDSAAHAEEKTEHQARTEERTCPVCQEKLNNQKMVFQCGHVICCKCKFLITWYPSFQLQVTVIVNVLFYTTYLYLSIVKFAEPWFINAVAGTL